MTISLAGLHLLVTRPQEQAEKWKVQLQELNATVSCQPVMTINAVEDDISRQQIINRILSFDEYQKVIFISQNAVHYGMQWLDQYWPQLPVGVDFFAIGKTTAEQLQYAIEHLGDSAVYNAAHAMNSEALLAHPQLQSVDGEKILIFRGKHGRTLLAEELESRGAKVDYCELYERQCPDGQQAIENEYRHTTQQAVTVVHSGESLRNLCSIVVADDLLWLKEQPLLVPGDRVGLQATQAGFQKVLIAENATHDSMVSTLKEWKQQVC